MSARALPRRASSVALWSTASLALAALALLGHALWLRSGAAERQARTRHLVQALNLTDATWFTEARYTRHLSQADLHSAFQDAPGAREHFPSGSVVSPPQALLAPAAPRHPQDPAR